jgi:cytidine deaminase
MGTNKKNIKIVYNEIGSIDELPEIDKHLLDTALRAVEKAYAPYSAFKVGAAVLLEGGLIVSGSNQENAAYSSGLCAERVAVFAASSEYPGRIIERIAVVSKDKNGQLRSVTPCGSCRQVLYEYERRQDHAISVLMIGEDETLLEFKNIDSLLPFGFSKDQMA